MNQNGIFPAPRGGPRGGPRMARPPIGDPLMNGGPGMHVRPPGRIDDPILRAELLAAQELAARAQAEV